MKRALLLGMVVGLFAGPALAGLSVSYEYIDSATHDLSSPYASLPGFAVDTFNAGTTRADWTYGGNYAIRLGDVSGKASAPYDGEGLSVGKDTTRYLAVPLVDLDPVNSGLASTATVSFGGGHYGYLGLHWGSMDSYNEIAFFLNGALQDTITGAKVSAGGVNRNGEGQQLDRLSNSYVNIFTDFAFDSIQLRSYDTTLGASPFAFELDNLTVAVPVPGAVLLGFLGLSAAGLKLRRLA